MKSVAFVGHTDSWLDGEIKKDFIKIFPQDEFTFDYLDLNLGRDFLVEVWNM